MGKGHTDMSGRSHPHEWKVIPTRVKGHTPMGGMSYRHGWNAILTRLGVFVFSIRIHLYSNTVFGLFIMYSVFMNTLH